MGLFSQKNIEKALNKTSIEKKHTIMIVDDEEANRFALMSMLQSQYHVLGACDGYDAMRIIEDEECPKISLIICDQRMPRMTGTDFLKKMTPFSPKTKRIILTGFMDIHAIIDSINKARIYQFVVKPYDRSELLMIIQQAVRAYELEAQLEEYHHDLEAKVKSRAEELEKKGREVMRARNHIMMQRKMASMGTLAAGLAQEIRNPLNFINNFALLSTDRAKELRMGLEEKINSRGAEDCAEFLEALDEIEQNCQRIYQYGAKADQIVQSMLEFASSNTGEWQKISINSLLEKFTNIAFQGVKARFGELDVEIVMDFDEEGESWDVVPQGLSRAVVNLVINALEALAARKNEEHDFKPTLWVRTYFRDGHVEILIEDNGEGIAEENLERIFEPYFTTRAPEEGNIGLGLVIAKDVVVHEHGGTLSVVSLAEEHTRFTICLPSQE